MADLVSNTSGPGLMNATSGGLNTFVTNASHAAASEISTLATAEDGSTALSWFGLLVRLVLFMIQLIPGILYISIAFATITLPTWLFTLGTRSLTLTMNFTTLYVHGQTLATKMGLILARLLIVVAFASTVSWVVRYRFLNMYARLPPEPQRKEAQIELFPDAHDGDSKPGLANYLDEFLSAIKVFGYRKCGTIYRYG